MGPDDLLLVLVAGKDPAFELSGGHSAYVLAHARAAMELGRTPVVLCLGSEAEVRDEPYGTVHRIRTRAQSIRQLAIPWLRRPLRNAILDLASATTRPVVVHGFGVWGSVAVDAVGRLRKDGRSAAATISSYTTYRAEHASLVRGAVGVPLTAALRYRLQALWVRAVVDRIERQAYRQADRVWANYRSVGDLIHEAHGPGVDVDLLPYAPVPIDGDETLPSPALASLRPAEAPLIVSVARHHSRKGVDVLIDALGELAAVDVRFRACLVGDGPLLAAHRVRVVERGLADSVLVVGAVLDAGPYLAAADVFVLPSRAEQSGSVAMLEALRAGLPVVATDVDGIPEDVTHEESALLARPGDVGSLAHELRRVLEDADLRSRLGSAARNRYDERFSWEGFIAALGDAYDEVEAAIS